MKNKSYLVLEPKEEAKIEIPEELLAKLYLKSIWDNNHKLGFSFLGIFTGRHRAGKSLSSVFLSTILDTSFYFEMEERIVYSAKPFFKAMNKFVELSKKYKNPEAYIGKAIIWDEAGVGIPAREWFSISNKVINHATQILGWLKPYLFFVTPDISYIDSQPRKLLTHWFEVKRSGTKYTRWHIREILVDSKTGKIYYYKPRIFIPTGKDKKPLTIVLDYIKLKRPPKELEERYEKVSIPFKEEKMQEFEEMVDILDQDEDERKEKVNVDKLVDFVIKNSDKFISSVRKGRSVVSQEAIMYELQVPRSIARIIKIRAEKILNGEEQ